MVLLYLLHLLCFLLPFAANAIDAGAGPLPLSSKTLSSRLFISTNTTQVTNDTRPYGSLSSSSIPRASHVSNSSSPSNSSSNSNSSSYSNCSSTVSRSVYLVSDLVPVEFQVSTIDGKTVFNSFVALYIMGTDKDGPLRIEIGADLNVLSSGQATPGEINMVRAFDLGTASTPKLISAKAGRRASLQGTTTHCNTDFLDPNTGLGIVATAWSKDPEYRVGPKNRASLNSGHALTQRVLKILNISPNADAQTMWQRADRWQSEFQDSASYNIDLLYHDVLGQSTPASKRRDSLRPRGSEKRAEDTADLRTVWTGLANPINPDYKEPADVNRAKSLLRKWGPFGPTPVTPKQLPVPALTNFAVGSENSLASSGKERRARFTEDTGVDPKLDDGKPVVPPSEDDPVDPKGKVPAPAVPAANDPDAIHVAPLNTVDDAGSVLSAPKTAGGSAPEAGGKPATGPDGLSTDMGKTQKISFFSIDGAGLKTLGVVLEAAVTAVAAIADLVLGFFVMFQDIVAGEWQLAILAGVGAVVGAGVAVAAALAEEGPIGWFLALVIGLATTLPGILKKNPPGHIGNTLEIVQWSFYGDRGTTGNEDCNKQAKVKNCTVANGPGALSKGTRADLNNFDAIVFLLQFNDGYAMSLPDIAKAFTVYNTTAPAGAKDLAIIECNNKPRRFVSGGRGGGTLVGDDPLLCNHPKFSINRSLIKLPYLGTTADKIYNRIIPAPGGDCKLLTRSGDVDFPEENLVLTGLPCAIACGLKDGTNVTGTVVSPGDETTDGQNGAYIAPPNMPNGPGFPPPLTDATSVCLGQKGKTNSLCLPNGTYVAQSYYSFKSTNTLNLPTKAYIETAYQTLGVDACEYCAGVEEAAGHTFHDAITDGKNKNFNTDMKAINQGGGTINIFTPSDPLLACLFADAEYGGDVACFGEGGGALPASWNKKARSIMLHGGAWVWIYGDKYGDYGGIVLQGNQHDLSAQDYGTNSQTFSKNVTAIWVKKAE